MRSQCEKSCKELLQLRPGIARFTEFHIKIWEQCEGKNCEIGEYQRQKNSFDTVACKRIQPRLIYQHMTKEPRQEKKQLHPKGYDPHIQPIKKIRFECFIKHPIAIMVTFLIRN